MRYSKQHPDLPTETCKVCGGHGHLYVDVDEACPTCNGTGRVSSNLYKGTWATPWPSTDVGGGRPNQKEESK